MAVAVIAGLTFAGMLTMFVVPTLYARLYKVPAPAR
jgi:multidrug efflux pump subunit AcrB